MKRAGGPTIRPSNLNAKQDRNTKVLHPSSLLDQGDREEISPHLEVGLDPHVPKPSPMQPAIACTRGQCFPKW